MCAPDGFGRLLGAEPGATRWRPRRQARAPGQRPCLRCGVWGPNPPHSFGPRFPATPRGPRIAPALPGLLRAISLPPSLHHHEVVSCRGGLCAGNSGGHLELARPSNTWAPAGTSVAPAATSDPKSRHFRRPGRLLGHAGGQVGTFARRSSGHAQCRAARKRVASVRPVAPTLGPEGPSAPGGVAASTRRDPAGR